MSGIRIDEHMVRNVISELREFNNGTLSTYNSASERFYQADEEWQDIQGDIVENAFEDVYANISSGVSALNEYVDHLEQKLNALTGR